MREGHITQDDLALYALQALTGEESAAVRHHLSTCDACRAELAKLQDDLVMVALSVEQQPVPEGARDRFVRSLAEAEASSAPAGKPAGPVLVGRRPRFGIAGWLGWIAAAAMLIISVSLGIEQNRLRTTVRETVSKLEAMQASESRAEQVEELLTAPKAQRVLLTAPKAPPLPSAHVVYLASRGELVFQASHLASIPTDKTYELWVIPANGSAPIPAGLFRPDTAGNGEVMLPSIPPGIEAKAFGVTLENPGGSRVPTAPILLAGAVSASGE